MWYKTESTVRPSSIDNISSQEYVYIRKDITEEVREDVTYYLYKENKIPKKDWELYSQILTQENDISDVQMAICDLYEMIGI